MQSKVFFPSREVNGTWHSHLSFSCEIRLSEILAVFYINGLKRNCLSLLSSRLHEVNQTNHSQATADAARTTGLLRPLILNRVAKDDLRELLCPIPSAAVAEEQ
jgi:hypothetical protein